MSDEPAQAIYPYCNGDCNMNIYGQEQYDLQQQSAASTRTRWAWYLESDNNDPYHVRISSRQTEIYDGTERHAYFYTYQPEGYDRIVTTLTWPGITAAHTTEYMVLGTVGQYRLLTTEMVALDSDHNGTPESTERRTVNAFEQYWKTYDTVKKKVLGVDEADDVNASAIVPDTPASYRETLGQMGWHSYVKYAYAKRWNGYNTAGNRSKGWEETEHWFQTVEMGEGYLNFVPVSIDPVLILLDQHGWEIMRHSLPSDPDDPQKAQKYDAIRKYDSPMVDKYYFWTKTSKRSGFHQYYNLSQQVTVDGQPYSSTSLADLPPYYTAANIKDAKGNLYDQYVTYTVKEEYRLSYDPETQESQPFIIQQGDEYAVATNGTTLTPTAVPTPGGMSQYIISHAGSIDNRMLWYLRPNADIDTEMGIDSYEHNWTNDYTGAFSDGFDPYNIQVSSKAYPTSYFRTNLSTSDVEDGALTGTYAAGDMSLSLGAVGTTVDGTGHDSRVLKVTNATFMAVGDTEGNMQFMPRFDQKHRMKSFSSMVDVGELMPEDLDDTYTLLFRPLLYNYIIVDNDGREALRYQSGGDLRPQTPDHFVSQLAKNFTYHKTLASSGTRTYDLTTLADQISESLAGIGLTNETAAGNTVYVRYEYDSDADLSQLLLGKWMTMKVNGLDAVYADGGIKQGSSRPTVIDGEAQEWQWKLTETPQTDPDPYAVMLYNRSKRDGATQSARRFALLKHGENVAENYALAICGTGRYSYDFLNANGAMDASTAAAVSTEPGFLSTSCSFVGTNSQVTFVNDVEHTFTYKVYTNGTNGSNAVGYGVLAITAEQPSEDVLSDDYEPILPEAAYTPLLNIDQYLYYEHEADMGDSDKELSYLFGLWDDEVYVRYTAYDKDRSPYLVPNAKTTVDGHVARAPESNDAPLSLSNDLLYNIVWYDDNMMKSDDGSTAITGETGHALAADIQHEWILDGNDPYAIKIRHKHTGTLGDCIYSSDGTNCSLSADNATTFMLLNRDGYDYGVLQVTGGTKKLTNVGDQLTDDAPTKFIIFALASHGLIYHLVIANIGETVKIPYAEKENGARVEKPNLEIKGSTKRDLTTTTTVTGDTYQLGSTINGKTYCVDAGHVSLGDVLRVPAALKRPNCKYFFYVDGIYSDNTCTTPNETLNNKYKGLQVDHLGTDEALLNTYIVINIVYEFDDGLPTNNGSQFVLAPTDNKWYTIESGDGTPWLAQYTNAWGFEVKEGRESRYTNDYLWAPVGDPYGFVMYNRYIYKTDGETTKVLTTGETAPADGGVLTAQTPGSNGHEVYELLAADTEGYFRFHPVVNNTGTQYYLHTVDGNDGAGLPHKYLRLGTEATELTFGLSEELVLPYYERTGYVGGLTTEGKALYEAAQNLMEKQAVVYDDANIVQYKPGYYRFHSQPGIPGIAPVRYASAYTHEIETRADEGNPIPMHFYERKGVNTDFESLKSGYTVTEATRGDLPVPAAEYDPGSIFHVTGATATAVSVASQGLNVIENTMGTGSATSLRLMDVGGAVLLIHDNAEPAVRNYLCFDQSSPASIYDLAYKHDVQTDYAKWCMEAIDLQGLRVATHNGGDAHIYDQAYFYTSFYAPFDVLLPADNGTKVYKAYACQESFSPWSTTELHPRPIGEYNTEASGCPAAYRGSDRFVPAGTPVLIATTDNSGYVTLQLPTAAGPSTSLPSIFKGEYLEQKLADGNYKVYVFGMPLMFKDEPAFDFASTGRLTHGGAMPLQTNTNLGFYLNANPNREEHATKAEWIRNNHYVYANRVYYKDNVASPAHRRFVPVVFDDLRQALQPEEADTEEKTDGTGCVEAVYDLSGRRVASTADASWQQRVKPGIYIVGGQKYLVK